VTPLALTFDDGPDTEATPRVLDALSAAGARATFFPIAPRAAAHPDLVKRMLSDGHTVGLHCHEHVRHSERNRDWGARDADRALSVLRALGANPRLWRTPWGERATWTSAVADARGLRLVGWTVDTHDWRGDSATTMFAATRSDLRPGAVILAHDGIGPGSRRDSAAETIRYTTMVLEHAHVNNLTLEALA
jgi:peptidoglycan/xylan/chitin deacetylase (PgdA/CDA1 family)